MENPASQRIAVYPKNVLLMLKRTKMKQNKNEEYAQYNFTNWMIQKALQSG